MNLYSVHVGANIGYNSLMFSDYGPVIAFEPVFNEIVNMNMRDNNLKHKVSVYGQYGARKQRGH